MNLSAFTHTSKARTAASFLTASLLGVLFHFVYELSGEKRLIGLFFPVNESTWEHLKLIFFPIMFVSFVEYLLFHIEKGGFFCIRLKSALIGMISTIILFYTCQGVLGKNVDWINIVIYFIAMILACIYSCNAESKKVSLTFQNLCLFLILALTLAFMIFSVFPPEIGLFWEPPEATLSYRISFICSSFSMV